MRTGPLPVMLAGTLLWAGAAAGQPTGTSASTLTVGGPAPANPPHRYRDAEAQRILSLTPRPPLNVDCTPARERAARSPLEQSQYRLRCGR